MSWFWNTKSQVQHEQEQASAAATPTADAAASDATPTLQLHNLIAGFNPDAYAPTAAAAAPIQQMKAAVQKQQQTLAQRRAELEQEEHKLNMARINTETHAVQLVPRREVQVALQDLVKSIDALHCTHKEAVTHQRNKDAYGLESAVMLLQPDFDRLLGKMCEVITLLHPEQSTQFVREVEQKKRRIREDNQAREAALADQRRALYAAQAESRRAGAAAAAPLGAVGAAPSAAGAGHDMDDDITEVHQQQEGRRHCKRTSQCCVCVLLLCRTVADLCADCCVVCCCSECRCRLRGEKTCSSMSCGCLAAGQDCSVFCACCAASVSCKNTANYRQARADLQT